MAWGPPSSMAPQLPTPPLPPTAPLSPALLRAGSLVPPRASRPAAAAASSGWDLGAAAAARRRSATAAAQQRQRPAACLRPAAAAGAAAPRRQGAVCKARRLTGCQGAAAEARRRPPWLLSRIGLAASDWRSAKVSARRPDSRLRRDAALPCLMILAGCARPAFKYPRSAHLHVYTCARPCMHIHRVKPMHQAAAADDLASRNASPCHRSPHCRSMICPTVALLRV